MIRWVVRDGDGKTVGAIVARAGGDPRAVGEGRVFVGRVRAREEGTKVEVGDEVTFSDAESAEKGGLGPRVLLDEEGLVAVDKPAGMPTIPDQAGASHSLLAVVAERLGCTLANLHPTSRLDREVSGVVIFARTEEAAVRLRAAREEGRYARRYVALAAPGSRASVTALVGAGEWNAPVGRAKDPRHRAAFGRDAAPARTRYAIVAKAGERSLLALEPVTGRTHQLRVHAAHAGMPLLGDPTYGGARRITFPSGRVVSLGRIALHAARVVVPRRRGSSFDVRAEVPVSLRELWAAMGGEDAAWIAALEATFA